MTYKEAKEKLYMEWQKFLEDNIDYAGISDAYKTAFKALEQEPCGDCISRETARRIVDSGRTRKHMIDMILATPPVIPQPKIGRWIFVDKAKEHAHCSECDYGDVDLFNGRPHNYCPNCGAKMLEGVRT